MTDIKKRASGIFCVFLCVLTLLTCIPVSPVVSAASTPTLAYDDSTPGVIGISDDDGTSSYTWYRAKYDKSTSSWGDYEELAPTASPYNKNDMSIDPDRGTWLNLAVDGGGETEDAKYKYKACVTGSTSFSSELEQTEFYAQLLNGGFENPVIGADDTNTINSWSTSRQYPTKDNTSKTGNPYPTLYWRTSATDNAVEIITVNGTALSGTYAGTNAANGTNTNYGISTSPAGDQFAEINAEAAGSLYQKVLTYPGSDMYWSFYHSVRLYGETASAGGSGTDTMYLVIDSDSTSNELAGLTTTDQLNTKIESLLNGKDVYENNGLYIEKIADTRDSSSGTDWFSHAGTYKVPDGQYVTRFYFVSADSSQMACNNNTYGNFIDTVAFSVNYPTEAGDGALVIKKNISGLSAKKTTELNDSLTFNVRFTITDKDGNVTTETKTLKASDFTWKTNADGSFTGLISIEKVLTDSNGDALTVNYEVTENNYKLENYEVTTTKEGFKGTLEADSSKYANFYNEYKGVGGTDEEDPMDITKQIDAFRDGTDNADTTLDNTASPTDLKDIYRLYLTASGAQSPAPVDLVIAVDKSSSMDNSMSGGTASASDPARDTVVSNILNGQSGLISSFLNINKDNRVSVVSFNGRTSGSNNRYTYANDSSLDLDWITADKWTSSSSVDCSASLYTGTNYTAGFARAYTQFNKQTAEVGRQRIMIFLTDGAPTHANASLTSASGRRYTSSVDSYTKSRFDDFNSNLDNSVSTYFVYIGSQSDIPSAVNNMSSSLNGGAVYSASTADELKRCLYNAATTNGTKYENIVIDEALSRYVDFSKQVDMRIKLKNELADVSYDLYYRNMITDSGEISDGKNIITGETESILKSVTLNRNAKTVSVALNDGVYLTGEWKIELSFNVTATDEVYSDYEDIGYTDVGSKNTDYLSNATSSQRDGYYSNKSASVTYTRNGLEFTVNYPHPVVQADFGLPDVSFRKVNGENIGVGLSGAQFDVYRKSDSPSAAEVAGLDGTYVPFGAVTSGENGVITLSDVPDGTYYFIETSAPDGYVLSSRPFGVNIINGEPSLLTSNLYLDSKTVLIPNTPEKSVTGEVKRSKYIDAFRDGASNPDTTLDDTASKDEKKDLYRLYLDVSAAAALKPIDLMVVVDRSGSMQYRLSSDSTSTSDSDPQRAATVEKILKGDDGLISKFLNQNPENMVSVVSFYGAASNSYSSNNGNSSSSTYQPYVSNRAYTQDAQVERDWISASDWADDSTLDVSYKNSNGTNYSAGFGVAKDQFNKSSVSGNGHEKVMIFLSDGEPTFANNPIDGSTSTRYGNGLTSTGQNTSVIDTHTKNMFTSFNSLTNDDVTTYCIAIGGASTAILEEMVSAGNGGKLYQSSSYDEIYSAFEEIMLNGSGKYTNFAIDDVLSKYVNFADNVDLKVVLENRDTDEEAQTLCTQATVDSNPVYYTVNGKQYVKSAAINKTAGTVAVNFADDMELIGDWHIIVSYNAKGTEKIYEDYESYGYSAVGDPDTDYTLNGNDTSSDHKGFFPNNLAKVSFKMNGNDYTLPFTHPVVQGIRVAPDAVVIDYGIPVNITVLKNDTVIGDNGKITGVFASIGDGVTLNNFGYTVSQASGLSDSLTLKHGSVRVINNEIKYTPSDMTMSEPDVFYYEYKTEDNTYLYTTVTVIPAANIYYEDDFFTFSDGWTQVGSKDDSAVQAEDRPGNSAIAKDANNVYGYDSAYENETSDYSLGSAVKTTVSSSSPNYNGKINASFVFKGTGFDLFSLTDADQGAMQIKVYKMNSDGSHSNSAVEDGNRFIDNYYGYKYDTDLNKFVPDDTAEGKLYQIPVFRIRDLDYDTYYVELIPRYLSKFDIRSKGSYDLVVDSVRIYDPAGRTPDVSSAVGNAYILDNEYNAEYVKLRTSLISKEKFFDSAKDLGDGYIPGTIFIDGIARLAESADGAISNYETAGPNNEIYLTKGQAIAFNVSSGREIRLGSLQIGLKVPSGGASEVLIMNDSMSGFDSIDVSGAGEKFYKISKYVDWDTSKLGDGKYESASAIIIVNNSDSVLSVTSLKWTWKNGTTDKSEPLNAVVTAAAPAKLSAAAKVMLSGAKTDGESFDISADDIEIRWNQTEFKNGDTASAVITTPADVTGVRVGDAEIHDYVLNSDGTKTWTVSFTVTESTDGNFDVLFTTSDGRTLAKTDGETIRIVTPADAPDTSDSDSDSGEKTVIQKVIDFILKIFEKIKSIFRGWRNIL